MTGHPVTRNEATRGASAVPRSGSIYDRLDEARAQRSKTLAPAHAANDHPPPAQTAWDARPSKLQTLPEIKSQEAFDPPEKTNRSAVALKVGLGLIAFSIMAGFTIMTDVSTSSPQTDVTAPAHPAPSEPPKPDTAG